MKAVFFVLAMLLLAFPALAQTLSVRRELVTRENVSMRPGQVIELPTALCPSKSAITGCGCTATPPSVVVQTNEMSDEFFGACVCAFKNVGSAAVNVDLQSQAHCLVNAKIVVA